MNKKPIAYYDEFADFSENRELIDKILKEMDHGYQCWIHATNDKVTNVIYQEYLKTLKGENNGTNN